MFDASRFRPAPWAAALLLAVLPSLVARNSGAQTFARILSPANPVLADALESGGSAWADLDGDGDLDLFVPHGNLSSQNNGLFVNLGGFQFQRVVTGPVPADGGSSIGGCWGDFDRDGLLDLFVTNRNNFGNFLYRGTGDTTFTRQFGVAAVTTVGNSNSASWLDLDRDGDLDLHVINFQGDDFLFLNSGPPAWSLDRVTPAWLAGTTFSIHGTWADFDLDGDLDLFVGNAGNENDQLWIQGPGLSFTKRDILDGRSSLGASWEDFDGDGDMDLFVANYLGQESILYRNGGAPDFALTPVPASVFPSTLGSAVGSAWGDVDNDGDSDLLVAFDNGQHEGLFLNSGPPGWTFTRVASGDLVSAGGNSFGCALVDVDDDRDLDAFVANRTNQVDFLFRNDSPTRHALAVRLRGVMSSPRAEGARVAVLATLQGVPRWQHRQVLPISGYNTQNLDLHFGLDDATTVDRIEVEWPSGIHQVLTDVAADQRIEIVEDLATAVAVSRVRAVVDAGAVEIEWIVPNGPGTEARLERRGADSSWRFLASARVDPAGRVSFRDTDVVAGAEYEYRLRLEQGGAGWTDADLVRVSIPAVPILDFSLALSPGAGVTARLRLPGAGEARVELLDAGGRLVASRRERVGAGESTLPLAVPGDLAPGLYFGRLRHPAGERTARLVVLR